jgi:hypothetical protein
MVDFISGKYHLNGLIYTRSIQIWMREMIENDLATKQRLTAESI